MCNLHTEWTETDKQLIDFEEIEKKLKGFEEDEILVRSENGFKVTERAFVRNISMAFDQYLDLKNIGEKMFSKTI
jgi:coproporphyrinogen III oxidase-like Fe-S oxidoreductase